MSDTQSLIACPHCKKSFPASQAFSHQIDEAKERAVAEVKKEFEEKQSDEVTNLKKLLKDKEAKADEMRERELKLLEEKEKIEEEKKEIELKVKRQMDEERQRIKERAQNEVEEAHRLKDLEKEKKIQEQAKALEEMQRKLQQGSQQTQGEVLEEHLEQTLRAMFVFDSIEPVPKGIRGADIIQVVQNRHGNVAGKIIWESKRTKAWSNEWVTKLKSDKRSVKADLAVLVSDVLPNNMKNFGSHEGIWVSDYQSIIGIATVLRSMLLEVAIAKSGSGITTERKDMLFDYIQGIEFRNRVEAISEAFKSRREEIEIEKKWFTKKWAREEKTITSLLTNNESLKGELESITGSKMDESNQLELLDSGEEQNEA
ncbi:MAG: DUF2130 domain-containing protein [Patescibacteria group bacterium]